ncbi:sugar-binding domain-containing protein [Haloferula chungangensis]|uniref:Sugar-binding domain-containing protein n=1 Tax=Haloferula chungangensis TaxID=1048331 RepID=A0ABW2L2Q8_9BACT
MKFHPVLAAGMLSLCSIQAEPFMGSSRAPEALPAEVIRTSKDREVDFNFGWKFIEKDVAEAATPDFDDSKWRNIRLPHDWSVEHSFDEKLEGATAYLPGGMGWYRKTFEIELKDNQACSIYFDGIYNNSEIWLNGERLGFRAYGYTPIVHDLTPHLKRGENVIAVRVDRSRIVDSRWYTGSGIYRDVKLLVTDKLHTPLWGAYVTTPEVTEDAASVAVEITVSNLFGEEKSFTLRNTVLDPSGEEVGSTVVEGSVGAKEDARLKSDLRIESPKLWSVNQGQLYQLVTTIELGDRVVDRYVTRFGIRTLKFDPATGFWLNGENMKIKGVCLHHDGGLVGAAVPIKVWERRLKELREAGCNAIRISHQPGARDFTELCDEMGFLVQVEFFDEWDLPKDKRTNTWEKFVDYNSRGYTEHFQTDAESDLKLTALRDRNHPSVIMWSIGNEIEWTYPGQKEATGYFSANADGNYFWTVPPNTGEVIKERLKFTQTGKYRIAETAAKLAKWTREMDTTRPVIANMILPSASHESGYTDALDIVGYSYRRIMYDYCREHYPEKMIMGTENLGQYHEWKAVADRPFVAGTFLWTGVDYLGETNEKWPVKAQATGLLDLAGFRKPSFHMMKSLWNEAPHVYLCSQTAEKSPYKVGENGEVLEKEPWAWEKRLWYWHETNEHWNYAEGESVIAEVYTNCPEVELFLNGESLGTRELADFEDHVVKWELPFAGGELKAVGKGAEARVRSHGKAAGVELSIDETSLAADGYDVAHVVAQLVDEKGVPVVKDEQSLEFEVSGPCSILGVDNGSPGNVQDFQSTKIKTHQGRALMIVQSLKEGGTIRIQCKGEGIQSPPFEVSAE